MAERFPFGPSTWPGAIHSASGPVQPRRSSFRSRPRKCSIIIDRRRAVRIGDRHSGIDCTVHLGEYPPFPDRRRGQDARFGNEDPVLPESKNRGPGRRGRTCIGTKSATLTVSAVPLLVMDVPPRSGMENDRAEVGFGDSEPPAGVSRTQ